MEDTILSINTLPESLHRHICSDRVRVREENGEIILTLIAPIVSTDVPERTKKPNASLVFSRI